MESCYQSRQRVDPNEDSTGCSSFFRRSQAEYDNQRDKVDSTANSNDSSHQTKYRTSRQREHDLLGSSQIQFQCRIFPEVDAERDED